MKLLTLIIHEAATQDLIDTLLCHDRVDGFTTSAGHGHSCRTCRNPFETSEDLVTGRVPRVRFDLLLEDDAVDPVLEALRGCESCVSGLGVFWVTPVERGGGL
jgi:nitrogen regulatory protein PII